jgi:predicted transcriptional regulator
MSTVTIELEEKHADILKALSNQAGVAPGEVVGSALELLADAALFSEDQPPLSPQQIAAIEEGLAAADRGDLVPHEDVFEEIRKKFG